jgi:alkanesulfonate monooxygenase SsuD/methylene tetrahydromethanopterin reductase-like flavin-dependent oxidoreductase (luciferase family)
MHFSPGVSTSPLLTLAGLAARTRSLRLATTSLLLPIHDPLRLAEEIASLDQLSRGRVIIGLGRGFRPALFSAFGIDPREKRDRFDTALDLILSAWRGESVSLQGTPFERKVDNTPRQLKSPYQKPHPPLAVAAFGPKGLRQAARRNLPYLASPMESFDQILENLEIHRAELPAGSTTGQSIVPIMRTVFVCSNDSTKKRILRTLEAETRSVRQNPRVKTPKAIARAMDAPIGERVIVGGVAEVTDQIARYQNSLGMNLMVIRPQVRDTDESERVEAMDQLLEEVWPKLD